MYAAPDAGQAKSVPGVAEMPVAHDDSTWAPTATLEPAMDTDWPKKSPVLASGALRQEERLHVFVAASRSETYAAPELAMPPASDVGAEAEAPVAPRAADASWFAPTTIVVASSATDQPKCWAPRAEETASLAEKLQDDEVRV